MKEGVYQGVFSFLMVVLLLLVVSSVYIPKSQESLNVLLSPREAPVDVGLTVIDNEAPEITGYYPTELVFNASGEENIYFNASFQDADVDPLSVAWHVDGNLIREGFRDGFDEFTFNFGCDVSGDRYVSVNVSDSYAQDSVSWDIDLELVECDNGDDGGSGNGGGGGSDYVRNFTVSRDLIELELSQGDNARESFIVENTGDLSLGFDLEESGSLIQIVQKEFTLSPRGSQVVDVIVDVPESESVGVKTASVIVNSGIIRTVDFVINIISEGALFDFDSSLREDILTRSDVISVVFEITDISNLGPVDVELEYFIKDFEDNEIELGTDMIRVDGSLELEKSFEIPADLEYGRYVFYAKLNYGENFATTSQTFRLTNVGFLYKIVLSLISGVILVFVIILVVYARRKHKLE